MSQPPSGSLRPTHGHAYPFSLGGALPAPAPSTPPPTCPLPRLRVLRQNDRATPGGAAPCCLSSKPKSLQSQHSRAPSRHDRIPSFLDAPSPRITPNVCIQCASSARPASVCTLEPLLCIPHLMFVCLVAGGLPLHALKPRPSDASTPLLFTNAKFIPTAPPAQRPLPACPCCTPFACCMHPCLHPRALALRLHCSVAQLWRLTPFFCRRRRHVRFTPCTIFFSFDDMSC